MRVRSPFPGVYWIVVVVSSTLLNTPTESLDDDRCTILLLFMFADVSYLICVVVEKVNMFELDTDSFVVDSVHSPHAILFRASI